MVGREGGLKVVFFDLGGTLWQSAWPTPEDLATVVPAVDSRLRKLGIEHPDPSLVVKTLLRKIRAADAEAAASDGISPDFHQIVARHLHDESGVDLGRGQAGAILEALQIDGLSMRRRLYPDSAPALEALSARGLLIGCITNRFFAGEPLRRALRRLGLARHLEVVAASCEVGFLKPHPAIYQWALRAADCHAHQAVMVGDSLRADVEGARTAGLRGVWLRREGRTAAPQEETSAPTIQTLEELPKILDTQ